MSPCAPAKWCAISLPQRFNAAPAVAAACPAPLNSLCCPVGLMTPSAAAPAVLNSCTAPCSAAKPVPLLLFCPFVLPFCRPADRSLRWTPVKLSIDACSATVSLNDACFHGHRTASHSFTIGLRLALLVGCHWANVLRRKRYSFLLTPCTAGLNAGYDMRGDA